MLYHPYLQKYVLDIRVLFIILPNLKVIHGSNQMLQCSNFRVFISGALFVGVKQVTSLCGTALFSIPTTLQSSSDLFSKNLLSSFLVLPPVFCEAVMHSVMGISIGQVQMHLKARLAVMCLHSLCAVFALCHNGVRSACFNSISVVKLPSSSSQ